MTETTETVTNPEQKDTLSDKTFPVKEITKTKYSAMISTLESYSQSLRNKDVTDLVIIKPIDLVNDLLERTDLGTSTMSTYRSALLWHFKTKEHIPECAEAVKALVEFAQTSKTNSKAMRIERAQLRKGSRRRHLIPEGDLNLLIEELTEVSAVRKSVWASRAQRWMKAGLATGIRPYEWLEAEWVDDTKTELRVVNGKKKLAEPAFIRNRRKTMEDAARTLGQVIDSKGEDSDEEEIVERIIPLDSAADRVSIEAHMANIKDFVRSGEFTMAVYRDRCSLALWRVCKKLWGEKKLYSLYSARKQYSANQKALHGSERASELMGHSRPDTPSSSYYGKANQAHTAFRNGGKENLGKDQSAETDGLNTEKAAAAVPMVPMNQSDTGVSTSFGVQGS